MRLLTHNTLRCNRKDVAEGFPLRIVPRRVEVRESAFNAQFIRGVVSALDWPALVAAARACGMDALPAALEPALVEDQEFLKALHHVLMDVHVIDGELHCPESGQVFPITDGIPNMRCSPCSLPVRTVGCRELSGWLGCRPFWAGAGCAYLPVTCPVSYHLVLHHHSVVAPPMCLGHASTWPTLLCT